MLIPSCKQILDQNFNVLAVFNLPLYKFNMPALHKELLAIRKDRFATNDRIIFTMFDHDYHLDYQGAGWTFRNLQSILAHLDISNFFLHTINTSSQLGRICNRITKKNHT